ncbi:hypothetical protein KFL_001170200 [Klebsormidium nitens]|uniref:VanZ-like domain-containing protein n=1 Tax=Klebsormidium nitens TaxID=105231 RepID=A0A1Y1I1H3_KLENI|nr:hypothetical protein KFL_001170200 [Klebsormidium nitens]|eukprot:GAQ82616.1 hypothetical protein KFL_001170200 [Klebsormidium nitens]
MSDGDTWFGTDKFQHFFAVFCITSAAIMLASRLHIIVRWRFVIGASVGFLVSAAKEIGDELHLWYGRASLRDGVADAMGIASGVAAYGLVEHWWSSRQTDKKTRPMNRPAI